MPQTSTPLLSRVVNADKRTAIIDAVAGFELPNDNAWHDLDRLSARTDFEALDAVPEGIFEREFDDFEVIATVSVKLGFKDRNDELIAVSDAYPARVFGSYDPDRHRAYVRDVQIDTSSFNR